MVVDTLERRKLIEDSLNEAGGWVDPLRKLDEVVYLAEWPTVLTGRIDERFLELPDRVVITAMQSHQRYFPVRSGERLEPRFLFVANSGDPADGHPRQRGGAGGQAHRRRVRIRLRPGARDRVDGR